MRQSAWKIVCGVSLMLLAWMGALWLRSYWPIELHVFGRDGCVVAAFVEGHFINELAIDPQDQWCRFDGWLAKARTDGWSKHWSFAGVEYVADGMKQRDRYGRYRVVLVSYAYPFAMLAVVSGWLIYRARRQGKRFGAGLCAKCGYDLRASAGRCPECGEKGKGMVG